MAAKAYTRSFDWNDETISATRKGWLVSASVRISNSTTDWRVFLPFGGDFPRGCDLDAAWNDYTDNFSALFSRANDCRRDEEAKRYYHARILSRGYEVR